MFETNFCRLMDRQGLTPVGLAAKLETLGSPISPRTVYHWRTGHTAPRAEMLPAIAQALDVEVNDLFSTGTEG